VCTLRSVLVSAAASWVRLKAKVRIHWFGSTTIEATYDRELCFNFPEFPVFFQPPDSHSPHMTR